MRQVQGRPRRMRGGGKRQRAEEAVEGLEEEDVEPGGPRAVVTSELGGRAEEEDQTGAWEQPLAGRAVGSEED